METPGPAVGESLQSAAQLIIDGRSTHKMHKGLTTQVSHTHTNTHTHTNKNTSRGSLIGLPVKLLQKHTGDSKACKCFQNKQMGRKRACV